MKLRGMTALAGLAVGVGLAGFSVTGCQNLDVGTSIQPSDTVPKPGLDDGGGGAPTGQNVVPIERADIDFEGGTR